ncbi:hypothetical protein JGU66_18775 [Myxococcaceae bacterium JPH2]|nr:hypothetical protein [Myxococcaceae bacterium JPH2]
MKRIKYILGLSLAALIGAPAIALAATGDPSQPTIGSALVGAVVQALPVVCTALAGLIAAALYALTRMLSAQGTESKLAQVLSRASTLAEAVVREVQVTLRAELEKAAADGVLTTDELAKIKAAAVAQLKASLGEHGLKELQDVLRLTAGNIGVYLGGLIEAAVDRMKASGAKPVVSLGPLELGASGVAAIMAQPAIQVPSAPVPQMPRG